MNEGAEEKVAASELPHVMEPEEWIDVSSVILKLRYEIVKAISQKCPEIAMALVGASTAGQMQGFKTLMETLGIAQGEQKAALQVVGRSIASAWGAEPEWPGRNCAGGPVKDAA